MATPLEAGTQSSRTTPQWPLLPCPRSTEKHGASLSAVDRRSGQSQTYWVTEMLDSRDGQELQTSPMGPVECSPGRFGLCENLLDKEVLTQTLTAWTPFRLPCGTQEVLFAASYASSCLVTNSFSSAGLACPLDNRITWPTKNAATVFLPARYCSSCLGLAAMIS